MKNNTPKLRFKEFTDEWQEKKLGDVCVINPSTGMLPDCFFYIDLESVEGGKCGKLKKIRSTQAPSRAQRVLKEGDVLYQTVRPYQMNNLYFDKKADNYVASTGYAQMRAAGSPKFLFQYLHTEIFVNKVLVRCTGTSYPAINSSDLASTKTRFPSGLEQSKIADFLGTVDEKIEKFEEKKKAFEKYKKGVMQAIFSQKIRFKKSDGSNFPDWEEKRLGEMGTTYNGLTGKSAEDFGEGLPYITYMQIFGGSSIDMSKCRKVKVGENEKQNEVKVGDLFFTTSSETPGEVGFSSALLKDIGVAYLNSFCFGYRLNNADKYSSEYLNIFFRSEKFRRKVVRLAQGSTRFNLSKVEMMKIAIHLPTVEEQKKIAEFLTALDNKINLINNQLEQTKLFKKSLLQRMFV